MPAVTFATYDEPQVWFQEQLNKCNEYTKILARHPRYTTDGEAGRFLDWPSLFKPTELTSMKARKAEEVTYKV